MPKHAVSIDILSPLSQRLVQGAGARIASARAERNLTAQKLAADLDCSRSTLAQWENGVAVPPYIGLLALAERLRTPAHWLLLGEGPSREKIRGIARVPNLVPRGSNRETDVERIDEIPKAWIGTLNDEINQVCSTTLRGALNAPGYARGDRIFFLNGAERAWVSGDYAIWLGDQIAAATVTPTLEGKLRVHCTDITLMTREELGERTIGRIIGRFQQT